LAFVLFGNHGVLCAKRDDFEKNLIFCFSTIFSLLCLNFPIFVSSK
jgi:hypothetical protein